MHTKDAILNAMIKSMFVEAAGKMQIITPMRSAVEAAYEAAKPLIEANERERLAQEQKETDELPMKVIDTNVLKLKPITDLSALDEEDA